MDAALEVPAARREAIDGERQDHRDVAEDRERDQEQQEPRPVGPLERAEDVAAYTAALPAATITLCRLHASRQVLADRVTRRGRGLTPARGLAGGELIGQPQPRLREIADQAARILEALDGIGDLRVDTDDRPADDIAAEILGAWGGG